MKRVIFLIESSFPYYAGGIETWLYNVSKRLVDSSEVYIVSEVPVYYKKPLFELDPRIKLRKYWSIRSIRAFRYFLKGYIAEIESKLRMIFMRRAISRLLISSDECVVVALGTLNTATVVRRLKKKYPHFIFICSARGPHAEVLSNRYPLLKSYYFKQEKTNLISADISWANGYDTVEYFRGFGINTRLMKNGVDIEKFSVLSDNPYTSPKKIILSVATLLDIKCISELIKAFFILSQKRADDCELVFVGKGDKDKYVELARSLGISDRVLFWGHKSNVIPYLQYANVITCLSGGGGLSMAALESMASGRPVVAWDTEVYRQFNKQQHTMVMVEEKNVNALAVAINDILDNEVEYLEMCKCAVREASQYDWKVVIKEFLQDINNHVNNVNNK